MEATAPNPQDPKDPLPTSWCQTTQDTHRVKDHATNQCSLPHFTSFLQETPMKPSQVPNKLPHPPPRRMLPLQSPELCHRDKLGPQRHPPHHLGPKHSPEFVRSGPLNIGPTANRPHPTARDRLGPLHHSPQPPGSPCSWLVPGSTANCGTPANRPQPQPPGVFHLASPQFMKDLRGHSPSSRVRRDHVTGSKVTLASSGSINATAQRQDTNVARSGVVKNSMHTVELHRPPVTPLNARAAQEVCPLSHSERGSSSSLPIVHCPVTPYQDQQHKQTPSSEKLPAAVELNHSSLKRRREFGDTDQSAKRLCFQSENFGKVQTPKPTGDNSLSTSPVSQPCSGNLSTLEPKITDRYLCAETAHGQSSCASPSTCINTRPPMGAKQAYINFSHSDTVTLIELRSPLKSGEASLKRRCEANEKKDKSSSLLSSEVPQNTGSAPHFQVGKHSFGHSHCSTAVLPVKTPCRGNQVEESRKSDGNMPKPASKPNSSSQSCRSAERNKIARARRAIAVPDDIDELFTPDPLTYVVNPAHKTAKHKTDVATITSSTEKSSSSRTVSSSINAVAGSVCPKTQKSTVTASLEDTKGSSSSSACQKQEFSLPTVALERVKLENLRPFRPKDSKLKNNPETTSSGGLLKDEKQTSLLHNGVGTCTLEVDTPASVQTTSHCSQSPLLERRASEGARKQVNEEDPIDVELNLGLSFALDLDLTQSSHSSDDEQLLSLQEMMERATKPPDTPEKGAFSEPSTPGNHSCHSKTQPLPPTTKTVSYKNNLDQMLKEINNNKRAKEIETQLLTACKEDLLRIAEYEEAEENREEGISSEHQEFLQRYSLMSSAIRDVPPGQVVFNLERFGQIFNHDTLQLRRCMVTPQGTAQKTLLWSSAAHLRLHVNIGLFQEAYDSHSPCPAQVTCFLFKMMSVHSEKLVSEKILQALCDIACTAACQIVKNECQDFQVWVPSLADVALVLMNMGAAFVTLFPFENLQPPFTEGDLLEDVYIKSESPSGNSEQSAFPEHNYNNILKYLSYCLALCPRAYTDNELLLLLTLVGRVGLDPRLILKSSVELYPLEYKIVNNFKDWNTMLPRICLALTDLTDDHHNMCLLVQLLPDNTRGKQLRRHLSLSMISKLVDGSCTYRPTGKEVQLSELRLYLPRMQPSSLLRSMLSSSSRSQKDKEDKATLDQQSYYLCYSLLTLANEASNFQFFPAHQKEQLLILCSELETHVKCDIRENEKCLYRSKVKDLVARIYTKWQILLQRTRPLHGKLYDYWQPLPADTLTSSQEEDEMDKHADGPAMEEDGEADEENELALISQDEEMEQGGDEMDDRNERGDDAKPEEIEGCDAMDVTTGTEEAAELTDGEISQETPEMVSDVMDEQIEGGKVEHSEVGTENLFEGETQHDPVAACDLVS